MSQPAPNGITLKAASAVKAETTGARCRGASTALAGKKALLADQLHEVGDRLQQAERAGAVRPVAELHAAEELALDPRHVREHAQQQVDDQEGLDERRSTRARSLSPPRPDAPRSPACSAAIRTTPATSLLLTRARSSTEVPFERTRSRARRFRSCAACASSGGELDLRAPGAGTGAPARARRPAPRRAGGSARASGPCPSARAALPAGPARAPRCGCAARVLADRRGSRPP